MELKEAHDFVIIDCPAGIENGFKNAIAGASEAIVVTNPEVSAVRDADRVIGLLESQETGCTTHLILNRVKPDLIRKGQMLSVNDVQDILNVKLLGIVPEDEKILRASNRGEPAVLDASSRAGSAYRDIVSRLVDPATAPAIVIQEKLTWVQRIRRFMGLGGEVAHHA